MYLTLHMYMCNCYKHLPLSFVYVSRDEGSTVYFSFEMLPNPQKKPTLAYHSCSVEYLLA